MGFLQEIQELRREFKDLRAEVARHEEQTSGERGLSAAINVLADEVKNLRRTIWLTGSGIMVSIVGFGFAALKATGAA